MQKDSQAEIDDSSEEVEEPSVGEAPAGTVYFSDNGDSSFQEFSAFQRQRFQMNNNQFSTELFQQEHVFQTSFLGPADSSFL